MVAFAIGDNPVVQGIDNVNQTVQLQMLVCVLTWVTRKLLNLSKPNVSPFVK